VLKFHDISLYNFAMLFLDVPHVLGQTEYQRNPTLTNNIEVISVGGMVGGGGSARRANYIFITRLLRKLKFLMPIVDFISLPHYFFFFFYAYGLC
jgi:hypothetical protein